MKRLAISCTVLIAMGWCAFGLGGRTFANAFAGRFGNALLKLGEGKVASAEDFLYHRMFESAWLATLILVWILVHFSVQVLASRSTRLRPYGWIAHCLAGFLALNLWLSQATQTAAFWICFWEGEQTQNLARFHIKLVLTGEQPAGPRAVLVGSSQTRAQIEEGILNAALAPKLRTTDLDYPGSKALDVLIMYEVVPRARPDYVIWYVSEADFYSGSSSEVIPNFLTLGDVPDLLGRGGFRFVPAERLGYGILGDILPVFRLREVLAQRVLGPETGYLQQQQYDTSLETDLAVRAQRAAKSYNVNSESRFQQRAMEDYIIRCQRSGRRVILIAGQLHPVLERALAPAIRPHMLSFLRELAEKYPNVTLIEKLPEQSGEDYDDLTHVNRAAQVRFSRFLAAQLDVILVQAPGR